MGLLEAEEVVNCCGLSAPRVARNLGMEAKANLGESRGGETDRVNPYNIRINM